MTCLISTRRYVIEHISGCLFPVTNLYNGDQEVAELESATAFVAFMGHDSAGQEQWLSGRIDDPDVVRIGLVQ